MHTMYGVSRDKRREQSRLGLQPNLQIMVPAQMDAILSQISKT